MIQVRHSINAWYMVTDCLLAELLLLDEPTSGLDSFAAKSVMEGLRNLSFLGKTIVTTVHQPSAEVFRMFDDLCVLAEGQVVYLGPAHQAQKYFTNLGYSFPSFVNPADYMSTFNL